MRRFPSTVSVLGLAVGTLSLITGCSDPSPPPKPTASASAPPALTVQAPAPAVKVLNWGPQFTKAGQGFSIQKSGNSALWFEQRGVHSADSAEVWFDQTRLPGMAIKPNEGGSAEVPLQLLSKPGRYPVYLKLLPTGEKVEIGMFEVTP